jgi:hypothetical protein
MAAQSSLKPAAAQQDFSKVRHAPDKTDFQLTLEGHALLASIAAEARPAQLASKFPRIVNRMAGLWKSPRQMDRYFEDLLTDTRGNRQGFPLGILMELTTLKDYYLTKVFPPTQRGGVWDAEAGPRGSKL